MFVSMRSSSLCRIGIICMYTYGHCLFVYFAVEMFSRMRHLSQSIACHEHCVYSRNTHMRASTDAYGNRISGEAATNGVDMLTPRGTLRHRRCVSPITSHSWACTSVVSILLSCCRSILNIASLQHGYLLVSACGVFAQRQVMPLCLLQLAVANVPVM